MNAKSIIIAAALTLQTAFLFADNNISPTPLKNESSSAILSSLSPVTPIEATFEELSDVFEVTALIPVTPNEADFNDVAISVNVAVPDLAPMVPVEADFNDSADLPIIYNFDV